RRPHPLRPAHLLARQRGPEEQAGVHAGGIRALPRLRPQPARAHNHRTDRLRPLTELERLPRSRHDDQVWRGHLLRRHAQAGQPDASDSALEEAVRGGGGEEL
ncbi:hypothetical protein LTR28_004186, partial [Elasticomyces elasticus]